MSFLCLENSVVVITLVLLVAPEVPDEGPILSLLPLFLPDIPDLFQDSVSDSIGYLFAYEHPEVFDAS
jgi:hypothetical protein